jgi:hypothetical protein
MEWVFRRDPEARYYNPAYFFGPTLTYVPPWTFIPIPAYAGLNLYLLRSLPSYPDIKGIRAGAFAGIVLLTASRFAAVAELGYLHDEALGVPWVGNLHGNTVRLSLLLTHVSSQ